MAAWLCVTDGPLAKKVLRKKGGYLEGARLLGDCKEVKLSVYSYRFTDTKSGGPQYAKVHTNSTAGDLDDGEGYRIQGQVPAGHEGPLEFKLFFTLWNSKVDVHFNFVGRSKAIERHIHLL